MRIGNLGIELRPRKPKRQVADLQRRVAELERVHELRALHIQELETRVQMLEKRTAAIVRETLRNAARSLERGAG